MAASPQSIVQTLNPSSTNISTQLLGLFASMLSSQKDSETVASKLTELAEEAEGQVPSSDIVSILEESCDQKSYQDILSTAKIAAKRSKNYHSMLPFLTRTGHEDFNSGMEPSLNNVEELAKKVVLCVGAGGLGCEILKNLALSGIKNIVVIDLDTIDLSNLNRQFLFRKKDVGKAKAQVAAEFIKKRCKGVNITWHCQKIQEFDDQFYRQFDIVIAGLDNVKARLWLNSKLYSLIEFDEDGEADPDTIIPLVDGGSEGFKGQARVFLYPFYSCFECSAADVKEGPKFELCTIRNTPRIAEHCIAYALILLWPRLKSLKSHKEYEMVQKKKSTRKKKELCGDDSKSMEVEEEEEEEGDTASDSKMLPNGVKLDKDNPEHMTWVYERAKERANEFNIEGVTYNLTMQFVKNIIPAIASTNALISAACTNEAIKYLMFSAPIMDGYFYYNGQGGAYSRTFAYEKNPDCFTCGSHNLNVALKAAEGTIGDLKQDLENKYKLEIKAFFTTESKTLWNRFSGAEALNTKLSEAIPKTDAKIIMMAKNDGAAKPSKFTLNIRFE